MAPAADTGVKSANEVASGGKLHDREKHRNNCPRAHRSSNVTPEQARRIRELYAEIGSAPKVADLIGIGRTAVYNHLGLGRIKNPDWSDDEMQVLVDGYAEGLTSREIAQKLPGRTPLAVRLRMYRHRKEIRNNPKKRRALRAITMAFKVVRKADIFRELEV